MNTTKVSNFSANIFVNTTQNSNNNPWIPGPKKYEWFTMKSNIGDFGQHAVYTIAFLWHNGTEKEIFTNPRKSKSLKDLQILNEVIYNKKNVWMRRLFLEFGGCNYILLVIYIVNNIKNGSLFFCVLILCFRYNNWGFTQILNLFLNNLLY